MHRAKFDRGEEEMKAFNYMRATTLHEAIGFLAHHSPKAKLLAGGTDLLIEWRHSSAHQPETVIDISILAELKGIEMLNGRIHLKPLVTHSEILKSTIIKESAPLLSSAAGMIGSPQIRHRGTLGGNIMNAAACADTVPPLIALDAEIVLKSVAGSRSLPLHTLFAKPYVTVASADEILTEVRFSELPEGARSSFIKLGRRNALSISRLSVAAVVAQNEAGIITEARIVPGATFPRWHRVAEAEKMLIGERASSELFRAAGEQVSEIMIAETGHRWSTEYKQAAIAVLVRRALEQCSQ